MLRALERYLEPAVAAALPAEVELVLGPIALPMLRPTTDNTAALSINAASLEVSATGPESESRGDAHRIVTTSWSADGTTLNFAIPEPISGELLEVESPAGFSAKPGDDFFLQDRVIRFYRPPAAAAEAVRARCRGPAAAGWSERLPCRVGLRLTAMASTIQDADDHLGTALQVILAQLIRPPNLVLDRVPNLDVELRLREPRVRLTRLRRGCVADTELKRSEATLELACELALIVAKGTTAAQGKIAAIAGTLRTGGTAKAQPRPETFGIRAGPIAPALGERAIGGKPIALLVGVGDATSAELGALANPVSTLRQLAEVDVEAISSALVVLSPNRLRSLKQRARMVLDFPPLPPLPEAALQTSLEQLLVLSVGELSALTGHGPGYAEALLDDTLNLEVLLTADASTRVLLGDFLGA